MTGVNAIVLDHSGSEASRKLCRMLEFFGLEGQVMPVGEFLGKKLEISERFGNNGNNGDDVSGASCLRKGCCNVFGAVDDFLELAGILERDAGKRETWLNTSASAFCFGNGEQLAALGQKLGIPFESRLAEGFWKCSESLKDLTGTFAGLEVAVTAGQQVWLGQEGKSEAIIGNAQGAVFLRVDFHGVPLFLSTSEVIDLDAPLPARNFDVRPHFLSAVPVVLYIKSAFAETCWQHPEPGACVVLDDPLLRPRYGFFDYERMLGLMERLNFSTNVAFIPWNRKRSLRQTIRMFREHPGRLSLSVHGCDHTKGEYGVRDRDWLAWKSRQSLERMADHRRRTELPFDQVMVFPQGVFSETAMGVLKTEGFIGAVNSEVISVDPEPRAITIGEFWDVAVMRYSDFPIFTRRYPWAGVENFAFDILLGKPCLLNIHHNDCHDDYRCVTECITRLNRLNTRLHWTNLTDVVRRSYRCRTMPSGGVEVEIYGKEARLENPAVEKKRFRVGKRESAADTIREIQVDGQPVKWTGTGTRVEFEIEIAPKSSSIVRIVYREVPVNGSPVESLYYRLHVMARRYMSEWRDNVLMRKAYSE